MRNLVESLSEKPKDQEALWDMGGGQHAPSHSFKHKMIAMGSAAALRNLMANRPAKYKDANIMSPGSSLPSLHVRKQKGPGSRIRYSAFIRNF